MKWWERPFVRLLAVFLLLGGFAWWTFRTVSLPPTLRDLWEEDEAIAAAAIPATEEKEFREQLARLPTPPENHAPEVAALLERLRNLPPVPYVLANALARDAADRGDEAPPPWTEEEKKALRDVQTAFLQAWEPFFAGPAPDWKIFPDSVLLFRSQKSPIFEANTFLTDLLSRLPGRRGSQPTPEAAFFYLSYARQTRNLGAIRFGRGFGNWSLSDTVCLAEVVVNVMEKGMLTEPLPLATLRDLAALIPPAPSLQDLREGLEADHGLFLRTSTYLESLPPSTPAPTALTRWLQDESDAQWYLRESGGAATAGDLAVLIRRDAALLDILRQKTFLAAPAWRQWLQGVPGTGLSPLLAGSLGGFKEFENIRAISLVTRAAVDARIALEENGLEAARRIPDPARPGAFFQAETVPGGVRLSSSYVPKGKTNALSFLVPVPTGLSP